MAGGRGWKAERAAKARTAGRLPRQRSCSSVVAAHCRSAAAAAAASSGASARPAPAPMPPPLAPTPAPAQQCRPSARPKRRTTMAERLKVREKAAAGMADSKRLERAMA
jgi:hypothetical protein